MPLMGRAADAGQPLQSRLLSAGLVSDLINLAFLLHQRWRPYEKWRQAMFAGLPSAAALAGPLEAAATAAGWRDREDALAAAAGVLLDVQRGRGLPTPATGVIPFWDRPYRTVAGQLASGLLAAITDPVLARLTVRAGSVEQWADSVDVLADPARRAALTAVYAGWLDDPAPSGPP